MTLARRVAMRAVAFIVARPGLDAFLRRQVYRHPTLARQLRAVVMRGRRPQQQLTVDMIEAADLTEHAHQVLQDLVRAGERARQR